MSDKLETKIDSLSNKMDKMNDTLIRNTVSLEQHEYRTTLAEKRLNQIEADIAPIQDHVTFAKNLIKIIVIASSIILFFKQLNLF